VAKGDVAGVSVMVVKPTGYMNRSGQALGPLLSRGNFDPATDLLVLVDDVALPLGRFRLRARGSAGGHNGLRSIAGRLGSETYPRMRIGVGPRPAEVDGADYLLSNFESHELESLTRLMPTLMEAAECWVAEGIETAMNRYNRRGTESE
jgi:PTH1 family peptidyl-tRNA hydrolase